MTQSTVLPTRKREWQRLIDELGLRPNKGRGQNFLHDQSIVHRIVRAASVNEADHVLEIGPGLGMLTAELIRRAARVTAIELDATLAGHLAGTFQTAPSFTLIHDDALKVDLENIVAGSPVKVVANLPYSAAAAICQHLLEAEIALVSATVMVQREVAERMLAAPPHMSILAVATQVYASGQIDFTVPADVFLPSPAIESAVITLVPHAQRLLAHDQRSSFFKLVNSGFRHKRKNIANSIDDETGIARSQIQAMLGSAGIDPGRRAQTLSVREWLTLHDHWRWDDEPA